jgi:hypothetical protein
MRITRIVAHNSSFCSDWHPWARFRMKARLRRDR